MGCPSLDLEEDIRFSREVGEHGAEKSLIDKKADP